MHLNVRRDLYHSGVGEGGVGDQINKKDVENQAKEKARH